MAKLKQDSSESSIKGSPEVDVESPQNSDPLVISNYFIYLFPNFTNDVSKIVFPVYVREDLL